MFRSTDCHNNLITDLGNLSNILKQYLLSNKEELLLNGYTSYLYKILNFPDKINYLEELTALYRDFKGNSENGTIKLIIGYISRENVTENELWPLFGRMMYIDGYLDKYKLRDFEVEMLLKFMTITQLCCYSMYINCYFSIDLIKTSKYKPNPHSILECALNELNTESFGENSSKAACFLFKVSYTLIENVASFLYNHCDGNYFDNIIGLPRTSEGANVFDIKSKFESPEAWNEYFNGYFDRIKVEFRFDLVSSFINKWRNGILSVNSSKENSVVLFPADLKGFIPYLDALCTKEPGLLKFFAGDGILGDTEEAIREILSLEFDDGEPSSDLFEIIEEFIRKDKELIPVMDDIIEDIDPYWQHKIADYHFSMTHGDLTKFLKYFIPYKNYEDPYSCLKWSIDETNAVECGTEGLNGILIQLEHINNSFKESSYKENLFRDYIWFIKLYLAWGGDYQLIPSPCFSVN